MSATTKPITRFFAPRLRCLRLQASPFSPHLRHISNRYSKPSQRSVAATPNPYSTSVVPNARLDGTQHSSAIGVPLDAREARQQYEEQRSYHLRRMRFAGMGLLLSIMALAMIVYNLDLDSIEQSEKKRRRRGQQLEASDDANFKFQGKEVQVIGSGDSKRIVAHGQGEEIELVQTGTSSVPHFPRTIYLPSSSASTLPTESSLLTAQPNSPTNPGNISNQEEYTLIGLGIRTVMWLQVYVVGMYVRTTDISELQAKLIHSVNPTASTLVPAEKDELRKRLLDPDTSREIWTKLLEVPGMKTAWRIAPTRNTDFGHLRDGFINGINARTQEARRLVQGGETDYDSEDFGQAVQGVKGIFSGGKAPKGSILILLRDMMGAMVVLYQAKPSQSGGEKEMVHLGAVQDERIAKLIWLGYLAGAKVSSPAAREGVAEGCVNFAGRPVGSAESMVL